MTRDLRGCMLAVALAAAAIGGNGIGHALADVDSPIRKVELDQLSHAPIAALPGVANAAVLGAFDQPGLYAAQGEMKQGATFPPHSHPDLRLSIVTSGTMYLGFGETFDAARLVPYPVGTLAITPANAPHFMAALDGDVTILEVGAGPSGARFIKR